MCSDRPAPPRRTPHVRARPNPPEHARRPRTAARSPRTCDHGMMRSEGRWFGCPIHFRVVLPVESACLLHLPSSPAAVLRADPVRRRSHDDPEAAVRPELTTGPEAVRRHDDGQQVGDPDRPHARRRLQHARDGLRSGLADQLALRGLLQLEERVVLLVEFRCSTPMLDRELLDPRISTLRCVDRRASGRHSARSSGPGCRPRQ